MAERKKNGKKDNALRLIPYIAPINENIINNDYYSAIKNADRLVKKEEEFFGKL